MSEPVVLQYYSEPGRMTDLANNHDLVHWLTDDVRAITQVVQGLIVHDGWITRYGTDLDRRKLVGPSVTAEGILSLAASISPIHPAIPRSPGERVVACCREFALLMCAILRGKGVPARCRCGFATYLAAPGYFEDHWICECWNGVRWVAIDPQIDPFQQSTLERWRAGNDAINPHDLKGDQFISAARAWQLCRRGCHDWSRFGISVDPRKFGLNTLYGPWFVRGNLLRDFASLNKVETVPYLIRLTRGLTWADWPLVGAHDSDLTPDDYETLDRIASLACEADTRHSELTLEYGENESVRVPEALL